MRKLGTVTLIATLLAPTWVPDAWAARRLMDVRQVSTDTLRDVAVAGVEQGRPVIYYNPGLLQQFGPELTAFFLAHEYGHVRYGHTGAALLAGGADPGALRQRQELEADCYATRALAGIEPDAVTAAIRFFGRMGPFRFDALHPSGAQRAAKILACIPSAGDGNEPRRVPTILSGVQRTTGTGAGPAVDNGAAGS